MFLHFEERIWLFTSILFPANLQNKLFSLEGHAEGSGGKILGECFLSENEASDLTLRCKLDSEQIEYILYVRNCNKHKALKVR